MAIKYKLIDTDISKDIAKKIVGRQVTVERVKIKSEPITKPRAKAPAWFAEFRNEIMQKFDEQTKFNTQIEKDIANLKNDISLVKKTQDQQNKHLGNIENRLDRQEKRIENIENRMNKQDNRLENIGNRLDRQDERFENIEHELSI